MASQKLSDLTPTTTVSDTSLIYIVDGANDRKATAGNFRKVPVETVTTTGSLALRRVLLIDLNNAGGNIALTLTGTPEAGDMLYIFCRAVDTEHTVELPSGVTYDGTNDTATLNAAGEALTLIAVTASRYVILNNEGGVGLS